MAITFSIDPVNEQVARILTLLHGGHDVAGYESQLVDFKEEAGSREHGQALSVDERSDRVARQVAKEIACMANTPNGGALILGLNDDGLPVGATTDAEWLRHRVYELTNRQITATVREEQINGNRLLIVLTPEALEPVRWKGKINWRVGTSCVEIDPSSWHDRRFETLEVDWSGLDSGVTASRVRAAAVEVIRNWLSENVNPKANELAECDQTTLLSRLGAVTGHGTLTNAACLLFVGRGVASLDYIQRDFDGGDSRTRLNTQGVSLAEEMNSIFESLRIHSKLHHVHHGLVVEKVPELPFRAAREAVVNGVAHRDWTKRDETVVEHVGSVFRVTSPGGFFGTVNENNVLTHPSCSRNRALTQLLADVGVAEREGVGVDRMTIDMLRSGNPAPSITELNGPRIKTLLIGGQVDEAWLRWVNFVIPAKLRNNVGIVLLLRQLITVGWVDAHTASSLLQRDGEECESVISLLKEIEFDGRPLIRVVNGIPQNRPDAWVLDSDALSALGDFDAPGASMGRTRRLLPSRSSIALSFASERGRISTTELGSLLAASPTNVGDVLKNLVEEGLLEPSSPTGSGRGFHFRFVPQGV